MRDCTSALSATGRIKARTLEGAGAVSGLLLKPTLRGTALSGISELGVVLGSSARDIVKAAREFTAAVISLGEGAQNVARSMSELASAIRESVADAADFYLSEDDDGESPCERAAREQAAQDLPDGAIPVQQARQGCCRDSGQPAGDEQGARA